MRLGAWGPQNLGDQLGDQLADQLTTSILVFWHNTKRFRQGVSLGHGPRLPHSTPTTNIRLPRDISLTSRHCTITQTNSPIITAAPGPNDNINKYDNAVA